MAWVGMLVVRRPPLTLVNTVGQLLVLIVEMRDVDRHILHIVHSTLSVVHGYQLCTMHTHRV